MYRHDQRTYIRRFFAYLAVFFALVGVTVLVGEAHLVIARLVLVPAFASLILAYFHGSRACEIDYRARRYAIHDALEKGTAARSKQK